MTTKPDGIPHSQVQFEHGITKSGSSYLSLVPSFFLRHFLLSGSWARCSGFAALVLILGFGIEALVAMATGLAFPRAGGPSNPYFGRYFSWPLFSAVIMPAYAFCLIRAGQHANRLIERLREESILDVTDSEVFGGFIRRLYSRKFMATIVVSSAALAGIGTCLYLWHLPTFERLDAWAYVKKPTAMAYVKAATGFFQTGLILVGIILAVGVSRSLKRLFNCAGAPESGFNIRIIYLHPDNCCGLRAIGALAAWIHLMGVMIVMLVSAAVLEKLYALPTFSAVEVIRQFPFLAVLCVLCACGLPIIFFAPLFAPHKHMQDAKAEHMRQVGRLHRAIELKLDASGASPETAINKDLVDDLEAFHRYFKLVRAVSVWPFDLQTIGSFVMSSLAPILIPLMAERVLL